jgi:hypothetical protein
MHRESVRMVANPEEVGCNCRNAVTMLAVALYISPRYVIAGVVFVL